jgi:Tol biopolymer transport system component
MRHRVLIPLLCLAASLAAVPAEAYAQGYFGRNKVQYRSHDWQRLETPHFDIYFYAEARLAAMDAGRIVERSYARLSKLLGHEFRERKPIIVYASHGDFQQTNAIPEFIDESTGAFAEPTKNRIVIPFTGSYAEFEHVLTHELVHAFQFDIIYRRAVMSDANPFSRPPLWFMEGMAEYLSIGRIDAHTAAWVRDAALSGYIRTIEEMSRRDDYLSYRFGQSLWAYVGERWGDEAIGVILQNTPRIGLSRAFQRTLGITLTELNQEWIASVRQANLPQVTDYDRPDRFATMLTHHEKLADPWFLAPAISPDGSQMVFLSQRDGFAFDLWLADGRTGEVKHKLVSAAGDADFESLRFLNSSAAFSPDGRYIAFAAQTGGRDALYILDVERRRQEAKIEFKDVNGIANPTWSPDGQQIAFSGMVGGLSDLFITDIRGRDLRRLTDDRHAVLLPAWSPDGRTIAFTTDRGSDFDRLRYGNYRIALYHLENGQIEVLPHQDEGKNSNPVWSPDGRSLIWISDRTGINNLYLYELDSRQLSRLTDLLSGIIGINSLSPALSWAQKDGRLVFVHFEQAGYNVYAVEDPLRLPRIPVVDPPSPGPVAATPTPDVSGIGSAADPTGAFDPLVVTSFYRDGSGFRPSASLPDGAVDRTGGPISVLALLDSDDLMVPDTAEFTVHPYRVRFSPDVIGRPQIGAEVGGYYGNSVYGGSYIALSDMLGNHNIMLAGNVNGSFSDATFYTGYSFLKSRANWGIALQQVPFYSYLGGNIFDVGSGTRPYVADVFLRDVMRSAEGMISYPFSTFRRVDLGVAGVLFKRDMLYRGYYLGTGEPLQRDQRLDNLKFLQPSAALVFDNSMFGWTGPIFGRRYRLQASRAIGDFSFTEGLVDFRNYVNWRQRIVFASRVVTLTRQGRDADRFALFWGGPYFLRGYDGNSFDTQGPECADSREYAGGESISRCPVRDQLIGSSGAIMNLELRLPLVDELQIGFLGNFPPLDLVAFFDGGLAWSDHVCTAQDILEPSQCSPESQQKVRLVWDRRGEDPYLVREPLFSYGLGIRFNIFYTVLRMDYAIPLNRPGSGGRFSFSFGPSF